MSSSLPVGERCLKQTCVVAKLPVFCVSNTGLGETKWGVYSTKHLLPNYLKRHLLEVKSLLFLPCIFMTEWLFKLRFYCNVFCLFNPYVMLHLESPVNDHLNLETLVGVLKPRNYL